VDFKDLAESVARNKVEPESASVDAAFEEWLLNDSYREQIVGDFNLCAMGVSEAQDGTIYYNLNLAKTSRY